MPARGSAIDRRTRNPQPAPHHHAARSALVLRGCAEGEAEVAAASDPASTPRPARRPDKGEEEDSYERFDAYELDEDDALELPRFS